MYRTWKFRVIVLGILVMLGLIGKIDQTLAQAATPQPVVMDEDATYYGRLITETDVLTSPRGTIVGSYEQGSELAIVSLNSDAGWYEVEMMVDGEEGWVEIGVVELALVGSTGTYREYEFGICTATPTLARRLPDVGLFDRYQHELQFADEVEVAEIEEFYLIFNQSVREIEYLIDEDTNSILLPATWIIRHSGFDPRWDEEGAWQVEWDCSENSLLPTPTPDD